MLLPRRWVVERTFAWLNRNRRLACPKGMRSIEDFEALVTIAATCVMIASVKHIIRRLAKT